MKLVKPLQQAQQKIELPEIDYRIHTLCGEITWESVGQAITSIYDSYTTDHYEQLILVIFSPGGDTDAAWSLYTTLKNLGCKVDTLANGRLYSAGLIPFLAGARRFAFKESVFLFHPTTVNSVVEERPGYKIHEELVGDKMDSRIFKDTLLDAGITNKKDIAKLTHPSKSIFLTATAAKEIGLVTHIIDRIDCVSCDELITTKICSHSCHKIQAILA